MLVDTAGLRRKRRHRQGIEYYSELRALEAAERADVALVLIDAAEGVVDQDLAVADIARKADCATLIVLSKWDITAVDIEDVRGQLRRRLRQRPDFIADLGEDAAAASSACSTTSRSCSTATSKRIPTPELNKASRSCARSAQPPQRNGRRLNLLYAAQINQRPPRFRIFVNDPVARHARLRLLGRERAARRASSSKASPCRSTSSSAHEISRRRRGLVGHGVHARPARARPRRRARLPHRRAGGRDRRDGTQPALPPERRPARRSRRFRSTRRPADVDVVVVAVPSKAFVDVVARLPGRRAGAEPDEGPRPGDGRAALDARRRPRRSPCSPARTSPTRSPSACRPPR